MKNGKSVAYIKTKTALNDISFNECPIQRTILHEMGHGFDLNNDNGLKLYNDPIIRRLIDKHGHSSYYATTWKGVKRYKKEIADAISMVAYKDKDDKSTAIILSPIYDENKKIIGRELLDYEKWYDNYEELASYLEKKLDI